MTATTTLTLPDFLLARYAEEKAEADGIIERGEFGFDVTLIDTWEAYGAHIEVGVGRALADIEAKRRIIEAWQYLDADPELRMHAWTFPLRAMATVYADHPDYREEWRL